MNLGFEVVSAKSKKADADGDVAFEPMRQRARKEPRKQPSTDEKKVKRRLMKSAVAWSRKDSLDHDTEYVRQVLLSDGEMLEASVVQDDNEDEPTWAWLVYVADRADGGILEFVMSGSASGLDEAKGKADVALDRAEMDMMFERMGSRKQAASDQQETHRLVSGYLSGYNGDPQPDDNAPYVYMMGYSEGRDDLEQGNPPQYTEADLMLVEEDDEFDAGEFFDKQGVNKMASGNYYVFDEYPDDTGWAERPLAGPFATVEEASVVLKDVAYPFQFPYGPATVVGDLFIASELNEMSGEDFINQTMGSRRVAWTSQYADVADDEVLTMFEEVGHRFHPAQGFSGANFQEDRERVIQSITEALLASPYRERLAEFTQRHADYLEDINFHTLNEAVERAKKTLGQRMSNRRTHAGYAYQPDTQSSFDVKRYDQSPAEPFTNPAGHTYHGPEAPEMTDHTAGRSSTMQREADILEAMRFASLTEQRQLMGELNAIRANRKAARAEDRAIDLTSAVITDRLTPVLTKSMHTVASDWLDEVADDDDEDDEKAEKEASREMVAQATVWFKRLSSEVVADREEFAEQARGKARQLTSSLGTKRQAAIAAFLDAAAHLRTKQTGAASKRALKREASQVIEWTEIDGGFAAEVYDFDYFANIWVDEYTGMIEWEAGYLHESMSGTASSFEDAEKQIDDALMAFENVKDMDFESSRKRANEMMGYDGDYASNVGGDAMMDDAMDMPMDGGMDMDPRYVTNASRKQAMPQKYEIDAYTADELSGQARSRAHANWDESNFWVFEEVQEMAQEELARRFPSLRGWELLMEIGFSQGDGVWLAEGSLTDQQMRELSREFVPVEGLDYAITGRKYSTVEAQVDFDMPDEAGYANKIANDANQALSDLTSDLYRMASDYILDASSEEAWLEWSESMGALYDGSGRLLSTASRKTAMPSDDLINVDIDDYYGGDEGPDPDSQSGHAETALPYAGGDTTPAFRETGWTSSRRTAREKMDSYFSVFNLHVNDAGERADQKFIETYGQDAFDGIIKPLHDDGIMTIFHNEPTEHLKAWVDWVTEFVNGPEQLALFSRRNRSNQIARRKRLPRVAAKARCPECGRVFDLLDEDDADEWYSGHDCEDN